MGTKCSIGKEQKDGSVRYIYCDFDGYVDGVGKILNTYYTSPDVLDQLLGLGNIISLRAKLVPTSSRESDYHATVPYEGGPYLNEPYSSTEEYFKHVNPEVSFVDFRYLFTRDNKWVVKNESIQFDHEDLYLQDLDFLFRIGQPIGDI